MLSAENAGGSDIDLRYAARNKYDQLQNTMNSVCLLNDILFQKQLGAVEHSSDNISEGVHAVIRDPPPNTPRIAELSNSEHNRLSLHDMNHSEELLSARVDLAGHRHIFCSALQSRT